MRRAERLFRIVALFRDRAVQTAEGLAAELEVSERTIYRDIAHLQGSGIAIDGIAGLGYVADANLDLPPLNFTVVELEALALGLGFTIVAADGELASGARSALAKIAEVLPMTSRDVLDASALHVTRRARGRAPAIAARLRQAIRDREICEIDYIGADWQATSRLVRPLALTSYDDAWTLGAWCELRWAFRDFRLDRVTRLHRTGQKFSPDEATGLAAYLRHRGK